MLDLHILHIAEFHNFDKREQVEELVLHIVAGLHNFIDLRSRVDLHSKVDPHNLVGLHNLRSLKTNY